MKTQVYKEPFEDQGYLVVEDLLSLQEVEACEREVDRLHEVARDHAPQKDFFDVLFEIEPFTDRDTQDGRPLLRKIENVHKVSPRFTRVARHPKLLGIVRELLGPDLLLFRNTLMLKPAHHGSVHGFHQDTAHWPMRPPHMVTVSIALTDATPENGCFQVIPDSHRKGLEDRSAWGDIARPQDEGLSSREDYDTSGAIHVPLRAGSALFFHSSIVHGSGPNRSPNPRHTALFAFFTPNVTYIPPEGTPPKATYPVVAGVEGVTEMTFEAE